jgi:hypothetical protein
VNRGLTDWLAKLQPEEAAILSREQNEEFENCKDYQEEANGQADLRQLSKGHQSARESQREDREEDQRTER